MAEDKDLKNQTKQSISDVKAAAKAATETSISKIDKQVSSGVAKINKQTDKDIEKIEAKSEAVKTIANNAQKNIKQQAKEASSDIKEQTTHAKSNIEDVSSKQTEKLKTQGEQQEENINQQIKGASDTFKKLIEQQKKIVEETSASKKFTQGSTDLTTKILQNILSEIKVLRKVTEGRVSFDAKSNMYRNAKTGRYTKESDVREGDVKADAARIKDEKKKGFFKNIKDRFAKGKEKAAGAMAPLADGVKDIKEGATGLLTSPLVLAGLLALVAPKEVLEFMKGFLGEMLFGEDSTLFTKGLVILAGVWAGFKIYKKVISPIVTLIKGLFKVGRFLFMNPVLLLVVSLVAAVVNLMMDFRKKYAERMDRKKVEAEVVGLEKELAAATDPEQKKEIQERINAKKAHLDELGKKGVFSTTAQAEKAALTGEHSTLSNTRGASEVINELAQFDAAIDKQKNGGTLTKDEKATIDLYKTKEGVFDAWPAFKKKRAEIQQAADTQRGVTPKQETKAPTTGNTTNSTAPATSTATSSSPSSSGVSPTPSGAGSSSGTTLNVDQQRKDVAKLEESTPSTGQQINNTSVAVESGYDKEPQDSVTTVTSDSTSVPKPANVVATIPGMYADRSYFAQFEIFVNAAHVATSIGD